MLLLPLAISAQENAIATFHLRTDPETAERGWIVDYDQQGFSFERFGSTRRKRIPWSDLVSEDADALRKRLKLDAKSREEAGTVEGVRIHFKGGQTLDGLLVRLDADGQHWVRCDGLLLPYPSDRIKSVEKRRVPHRGVYTERQLYLLRLHKRPPRDADGHKALADFAFDIGDFAKAKEHYQSALRLRPAWRPAILPRLGEIEELLKDEAVAREIGIIKRAMRLERDYARARKRLDALLEKHPGKRSLIKVEDELKAERRSWLAKRFHVVKHEEFRRVVREYLRRRSPTIDEAMAWVRAKLAGLVEEQTRKRMKISAEDFKEFSKNKARGSPHWASYWSGTFVVSKRAKKGTYSKKRIRGDPNRWWSSYSDVGTRGNFLRAYAAEKLPNLFELIQIKLPPCERCGGTGRIKHMSVRGLNALDGGHEWFERCPRCYGARTDRVVGYR